MAGRKRISNNSTLPMTVTLWVRSGDDPWNQAPSTQRDLAPGETQWVEYGNETDRFLNGIEMVAHAHGGRITLQHLIIDRGSKIDDALNRNNAIDFDYEEGFELDRFQCKPYWTYDT